jgi:hypothetical protein
MTHADRAEGGRIRGVSSTTPAYPGYPPKDFTDLDPNNVENKFFCPDVGQVLSITVVGGTDREELVGITHECSGRCVNSRAFTRRPTSNPPCRRLESLR